MLVMIKFGGSGNDVVYGMSGSDILQGGLGNDIFYRSPGCDVSVGGAASDREIVKLSLAGIGCYGSYGGSKIKNLFRGTHVL